MGNRYNSKTLIDARLHNCFLVFNSLMSMTFFPRRLVRAAVILVFAFACCLSPGKPVLGAVGDFTTMEGYDLFLKVDYRWAGTTAGGYYPIRIEIENHGPDCLLTLRFVPFRDEQIPEVERRDLPVASEGKAMITLSVPMVGHGAIGNLEIERDGEVLEPLTKRISLSYPDHQFNRSSVLIISPVPVTTPVYEFGTKLGGQRMDSRPGIGDVLQVEPLTLPSTWTDYSGLDVVMISWRTLTDLDAGKRTAILQWAQTGGTLLIYESAKTPESHSELSDLLNLPGETYWQPANPNERIPLKDEYEDSPGPLMGADGRGQMLPFKELEWPSSERAFFFCDYLLGRVYVFPESPFPGTPYDWSWWVGSLPAERSSWAIRNGVLPRQANEDFFNFLIPGVTSVPVYAFLVLMTLFTIIIGPLNYIFLRRRKKTYMLLLTIPAIAFITSLTLFVYSTLAYGFRVTARSRSLTVLDQRANTAVALSRISLFAGIAPSEGLTFSPDTAVFPMWAPMQFARAHYGQSQFESGRVVWGEQQRLTDGWLRSRTRTQFVTVQHRTERGRLEIEASSPSTLRISNGLEWDIKGILWVDEKGNFYQGGTVGAGNTGELKFVSRDNFAIGLQEFHALLEENEELETPDDIKQESQAVIGMLEMRIQQLLRIKTYENRDPSVELFFARETDEILPPRSYLAVMAERPGIELGVEDADERAGYHLLLGHY